MGSAKCSTGLGKIETDSLVLLAVIGKNHTQTVPFFELHPGFFHNPTNRMCGGLVIGGGGGGGGEGGGRRSLNYVAVLHKDSTIIDSHNGGNNKQKSTALERTASSLSHKGT